MAEPPADGLAVGEGKRGPGRPRKLTAEARRMLLTFLCGSLSRADACKLVGVTLQTLTNEIKRDPAFKLEVHRAELSGKAQAAALVTQAAAADPKIALEYLQRKWPDEWGKRTRVKLEGTVPAADGAAVVKQLLAKLGMTGAGVAVAPAATAAAPAAGES